MSAVMLALLVLHFGTLALLLWRDPAGHADRARRAAGR